jgi:hypothetical protein
MPVRKLFCSYGNRDFVLEATSSGHNNVLVVVRDLSDAFGDQGNAASIAIDADDIPALCAELRRVAKLAKQGGQDGTR